MKITLAADPGGVELKNAVKKHGKTLWHGVMNMELPISFSQSKKL